MQLYKSCCEQEILVAKQREYCIRLYPVEIRGMSEITHPGHKSLSTKVTAGDFQELETAVGQLADDFGGDCSVNISLPPRERKPPGFDAICRKLKLHRDGKPFDIYSQRAA